MRFSVSYQVESIPLHYRMKVYSLIKEAIRRTSPSYYNEIFLEHRSEIKPFSFAVFLKDFKIAENKIFLKELTVTISSTMEFAVHALNGMRNLKTYVVDGVKWTQTRVQLLKEAEITSGSVYLRTLSPILVEDKHGIPLSPTDKEYEKELNYYANLQVKQAADRELLRPIRFTPIHMKKTVIKESNQYFRQSHNDSSLYFTTYRGRLKLAGHPDDLQLLYQLGVGKRTSFFGLLEYEGEEV